jgi:hypothetical protein
VEDNIVMDILEIGCENVNYTELVQCEVSNGRLLGCGDHGDEHLVSKT